MLKKLFLLVLLLSIATICFAQADTGEQITITTYYPSPYGVYKNLRLFPYTGITDGQCCIESGTEGTQPCTNNHEGDMAYAQGEGPLYCDGAVWQSLGAGVSATGGGASCNIEVAVGWPKSVGSTQHDPNWSAVAFHSYDLAEKACQALGDGWHIPTPAEVLCGLPPQGDNPPFPPHVILSVVTNMSTDSFTYNPVYPSHLAVSLPVGFVTVVDTPPYGTKTPANYYWAYCVHERESE